MSDNKDLEIYVNDRIIDGSTVLHTQRRQVEAGHLDQHKEIRQHHLAAFLEVKAMKFLTAEIKVLKVFIGS